MLTWPAEAGWRPHGSQASEAQLTSACGCAGCAEGGARGAEGAAAGGRGGQRQGDGGGERGGGRVVEGGDGDVAQEGAQAQGVAAVGTDLWRRRGN